MNKSARLSLGDVIIRYNGEYAVLETYKVEGWTRNGKLILRRGSGTILTTWWRTVGDLPTRWELAP